MRTAPPIADVRAQFPSLSGERALLENAGGSQAPGVVIDAIADYMRSCYVQLGAGYPESTRATETVALAHAFVNRVMNGEGIGTTILGPSTSQLCRMLADCYADVLAPGDEVIVAESGHESNVGPWFRLERFGAKVVVWPVHRESMALRPEDLTPLLGPRTRLIAFPHVSNILGDAIDVVDVTRLAHAVGARVVVDGVAYASHAPIDVREWDVDFYVYSTYKVYGPHMAAMFGKTDAWSELTGPNHFFISGLPGKFELGGACHEGCAGILALGAYLAFLAGDPPLDPRTLPSRETIVAAFETMRAMERPLMERLLGYLAADPRWRVIGPAKATPSRVATISFLNAHLSSPEVVAHTDARGVGIRSGNAYAYRLLQALSIDPGPGVVRASMVHYNTLDEVDRLVVALEELDRT
jgi:cysteine desulfurase family protein (TIGR01976 family)